MGIVASLAAIPVAEDVVRDEKRRELQKCLEEEERLRRLKLGEYRQGDLDLELIKRLSIQIGATEENLGPASVRFREGHTKVSDVEKIYLTGQYKQKYKTISSYYNAPDSFKHKMYPVMENGNRKIRSAFPGVVRLKSSRMSHHANTCVYPNEDGIQSVKSAALSRINC